LRAPSVSCTGERIRLAFAECDDMTDGLLKPARADDALERTVRRVIRGVAVLVLAMPAASCGSDTPAGGIVEPPPAGAIAINLTPASVALAAGGMGSVGLSLTRTGFDGPVTLSASGVPAGVSLTFGSAVVASGTGSTSVNISVTSAIPSPSVEVRISGTGGGVMSPAATLTLRPL
jgi:hypothetical protein